MSKKEERIDEMFLKKKKGKKNTKKRKRKERKGTERIL